jgi:hypothetical protein
MVDLTDLVAILGAGASIAIVVTVLLVAFQLRQNARLIEHSAREYRASVALTILERLTDDSFARRRKSMHDASKLLVEQGPTGFDDTLADLEARNFAFIYQILGALTRSRVVDEDLVIRAMGRLVIADWQRFEPISRRVMERYHQRHGTWEDFEWLAERASLHYDALESAPISGPTAGGPPRSP